MKTGSDHFPITLRLKTGCFAAVVIIGLLGCDPSTTPTSPPSPTTSLTPQPAPREPHPQTPQASTPPPHADDRLKIVAFGDSLTAGLGVAPDQTYPAQLQKRLDALGQPYLVLNAGVSGDTSAGGLRRVSWVLAGNPRVVILELGGNDGLRGLGLMETRSHLDAIIRRLKEAEVQVILAGMKLPPNYGEEYTSKFEAMYRELAQVHSLPLIPFLLEGVGGEKSLNQADGIHPTAEGYRMVVENVLKSLLPVLNERAPARTGVKNWRETSSLPSRTEQHSTPRNRNGLVSSS
ncbi:arylesterase [Nitrospira defluvii]|uniref:Arylesterase n=1 Tax=Nitrospira defluvii TaxID=330214 RepID=A0ABM8QMN1_9BACT|nr:arylesterase [Nitrospira defluvii]CAE6705715.1 Arylesterase precursor [Nitrospira defluvii]